MHATDQFAEKQPPCGWYMSLTNLYALPNNTHRPAALCSERSNIGFVGSFTEQEVSLHARDDIRSHVELLPWLVLPFHVCGSRRWKGSRQVLPDVVRRRAVQGPTLPSCCPACPNQAQRRPPGTQVPQEGRHCRHPRQGLLCKHRLASSSCKHIYMRAKNLSILHHA